MKKYKVKGIVVDSNNTVSTSSSDIESELTKILSEQLAKEVDLEILRKLGIFERTVRRKCSINKIYKITKI